MWRRFHEYWLKQSETVPVLIVRYEDLVEEASRESSLGLVRAFLQGQDVCSGADKGETSAFGGRERGKFGGKESACVSPGEGKSESEAKGAGYIPKNTKLGSSLLKIPAHAILQMEHELGPR